MTDYEHWALEYKRSADELRQKIDLLEYRRRHHRLTPQAERKLMLMYEMYGDCMLAFRELSRKADRVRRGETWTT